MIVEYPDKILRQKCEKVKKVDDRLLEVVGQLESVLNEVTNSLGLAAPQVGENLAVFGIDQTENQHSEESDSINIYINPQIIDTFDKEKVYPQVYTHNGDRENFYEGCLSFPNLYGTVKRWMEVNVRYQTLTNGRLEAKEEILQGLTAIVFQHELDHLKGVLFIDFIKEDNGKIFKDTEKGLEEIDIEKVISNK